MNNALIARNEDPNSIMDGEDMMPVDGDREGASPDRDNAFGIRMISNSNG